MQLTVDGVRPKSDYRPEIDGLRAFAVLPILLFHAGVPGLDGGFVGVDIFFVISGYLITRILAGELEARDFSLARFYERRIRRILPALFVVLAVTLVASWFVLLPEDLVQLGKSGGATLAFASNILFAGQVDYFAAPARYKPLLHCWSLAVEEQFYVVFPVLLAAIWRVGRKAVLAILIVLSIASLLLAEYWLSIRAPTAFFQAPARAWELLAGSLLALGALPPARQGRLAEAMAAAGLALIVGSILVLRETMRFPGLTALPPVLGTALILHFAPGTRVAALLSLKPLRFCGWISYSLYLWHWPVVVLVTYLVDPAGPLTVAAMIALSFALATASWRWVEEPCRRGTFLRGWRAFAFFAVGSLVLGALFAALIWFKGFPARLDPQVRALVAAAGDSSPLRGACHADWDRPIAPEKSCRIGADSPPEVAVWGDSAGIEPAYTLGQYVAPQGRSVVQLTHSACMPAGPANDQRTPGCQAYVKQTLAWLLRPDTPRAVILDANWDSDQVRAQPGLYTSFFDAAERLRAAGKRVVLVGPLPTYESDIPRLLARSWQMRPGSYPAGIDTAEFVARNRVILGRLADAERRGFAVYYPHRTLCGETCALVSGDRPLYYDDHHLTLAGARLIAPELARIAWP